MTATHHSTGIHQAATHVLDTLVEASKPYISDALVTCADVGTCLPVFELGFRTAARLLTSSFHIKTAVAIQPAGLDKLQNARRTFRGTSVPTDDCAASGPLHVDVSVVNRLSFSSQDQQH